MAENRPASFEVLPLTLQVEERMPVLGIGRNTAYELIRSGQIRSVRVGRQLRVPKGAVVDFLNKSANQTSLQTQINKISHDLT